MIKLAFAAVAAASIAGLLFIEALNGFRLGLGGFALVVALILFVAMAFYDSATEA